MTFKLLFGAMALALGLSLTVPTVLAAEPPIPKPLSIDALITRYSALYGISNEKLYTTLKCESNLSKDAVGDSSTSFGIAQIHLVSHPEITKEEALTAEFSIKWAAWQFSLGNARMWSCYNLFY